ncbi:MAG: adenylate/guanylate cyclase domain-containing protein [Anaerolineaceae bacterium]|jgi:predicted ATPase/class 3 adenylate cyclase
MSLPSGTVTFLFTDIERSTRLWERSPDAMRTVIERHDRYLNQAVQHGRGTVVKTTGDGLHAVFETAASGAEAACLAQKLLAEDSWQEIAPEALRVRMGLYSGEAAVRTGDYYGTTVNRAARLMAAGHGGQILLSAATAGMIEDRLPPGARLVDLGEHRLKDLVRPEHIFQLDHPYLPQTFPPIYTVDEYPNNLPVQLTSYIGREREMAEATRLLSATRLLTLIGPGGTGKTRLSLQVAADLLVSPQRIYPHGVWLAEFGPVSDPDLVVETVAAVYELRRQANGPPVLELLTRYLHEKELLLLMDNCEHLVEACARLAGYLLKTCPRIKIIASSREMLGVYGETVYSVPSMALPTGQRSPMELAQFEAVQLFIERAAAVQPHFRLTEQNAAAVLRICQRLDGIPLALELAAARIKVFTPEQIAARLDDRFRLLTGGSRTVLPRQQTLSALIDWSYDLLSAEERELLRKLSVFIGGWSFEAAESICPDLDVLTLLTNLVNKSLVIVDDRAGEARYTFLETIRQYARDKLLAAGESAATRDHLLDYYLQLTEAFEQEIYLATPLEDSLQWFDRLDIEFENIRGAIEWGLEHRPVDALRLAGYIHFYISMRASPVEGVRWLEKALAIVETLTPANEQQRIKQQRAVALGWIALGEIVITLGESIRAYAALEKGIPLVRALQDDFLLAIAYFFQTISAFYMNAYDEAKQANENLLAIARKNHDHHWEMTALALMSWLQGRLEGEALVGQTYQKGIRVASPLAMEMQLMFGIQARIRGDLQAARDFLTESLQFVPIYRSKPHETMTRSELGHIYRQAGDYGAAKEVYRQTIRAWYDLGHRAAVANQLECFAFIARVEGEPLRAVRLLGAAEALREEVDAIMTDYERPEYEQEVSELRNLVDEQAFARLWTEGRLLPLEEAVKLAVAEST